MTSGFDALPRRWRADRLVLSERHVLRTARVVAEGDAVVVVRPTPAGPSVAGYGPDGSAAALVAGLADSGELAAPLRWMTLPRDADLPPRACEALRVEPLPGWDWMSATALRAAAKDVPGTDRVERLDLAADVPAILDCLAEANPTTESDPSGPHEAGWWGVADGGRLVGVVGAVRHGGADDVGFSWHLHGLGVRPEGRRGGLGTALMVAATAAGLAAGADWVSLGVWAANEPALRIYRRLGFRTDHRRRSYRPLGVTGPGAGSGSGSGAGSGAEPGAGNGAAVSA